MKPGWQTSEFWLTLVTALPGFLVAAGFIPSSDAGQVSGSVSKVATGLIAAATLWKYIHSRAAVKSGIIAIALAFTFTAPSYAQPKVTENPCPCGCWRSPCTCVNCPCLDKSFKVEKQSCQDRSGATISSSIGARPSCFLGLFRQNPNSETNDLLRQIVKQNADLIALLTAQLNRPAPSTPAAPQQPLVIVLGGPQQQIPLGGPPQQQIPLGGPPHQDIPLGGPPKQNIPIGGPPQQQIEIGPKPKQDIPLGKPSPSGYQRYSVSEQSRPYEWRPVVVK